MKDLQLKTDAEMQVWMLASEHYGADLGQVVIAAIETFRRRPGLDGLTRVYAQTIGEPGLKVLIDALSRYAVGRLHVANGGVEIRIGLRSHLLWYLRQRLVDDGCAPPRMRDDHFAGDLGL